MQPSGQFMGYVVAIIIGASAAAGSIMQETQPAEGYRVVAEAVPERFQNISGPLALARIYNKYGASMPQLLRRAVGSAHAAARGKHLKATVAAIYDDYDMAYTVPVEIGTPAQTVYLGLDTGNADSWVYTPETERSSALGHRLYDPLKSNTSSKLEGHIFGFVYDGQWPYGGVYTDNVTVGGLTAESQAIGAGEAKQETWFGNVVGQLNRKVFVADLRRGGLSTFTFGTVPMAAERILYTPIHGDRYWEFTARSGLGSPFRAVVDTAFNMILLPDELTRKYWAEVPTAATDEKHGGYVFDCNVALPDFHFGIRDDNITVPGWLLNFGEEDSGKCFGGIQVAKDIPFALFGVAVLQAAYVVFDVGKMRIGWARKEAE